MTTIKNAQLNQSEIARLAYLNWQKDGCPAGRDLDYWLEAESQLKATWPLLICESKTLKGGKSKAKPIQPKAVRISPARMELAQSI